MAQTSRSNPAIGGAVPTQCDRIYVAGRLVNNTWEGDDGQRRYRTEIHASEVVFLDSSRNGNGNGGQVNDGDASDVEEMVAASPF